MQIIYWRFPTRMVYIEGSWPEWCISNMIYSRDTPFWSGTLDIYCISWLRYTILVENPCYQQKHSGREPSISTVYHDWGTPFWLRTLAINKSTLVGNPRYLLYIMIEVHHSGWEPLLSTKAPPPQLLYPLSLLFQSRTSTAYQLVFLEQMESVPLPVWKVFGHAHNVCVVDKLKLTQLLFRSWSSFLWQPTVYGYCRLIKN